MVSVMLVLVPVSCVVATYLLSTVPLAGAWLSGVPSRGFAVRLALGVNVALFLVVTGTFGGSWWAYQSGTLGPRMPFTVDVPSTYTGLGLLRFCPTEGAAFSGHHDLPASGVLELRHDPNELYSKSEVPVRRDGESYVAYSWGYSVEADGCGLLQFAVEKDGAPAYPNRPPAELLADVSRTGRSYADLARESAETPPPPVVEDTDTP